MKQAEDKSKKDCDQVVWSHHEGENGPSNWAHLCDGFSACGGNAQSPIAIVTADLAAGKDLSPIDLQYGETAADIIHNGHTVQFNVAGGSKMNIGDKTYDLLQFHYHAKSEHTIDGRYSPLEVHFVHKHSDTDFAVVGAMIEEGAENELFARFLDNFPTTQGSFSDQEQMIALRSALPDDLGYYHYSGSLTTPPCSEVVSWYMLKKPIEASAAQIEQFAAILDNNFRPVQALNGRTVYEF